MSGNGLGTENVHDPPEPRFSAALRSAIAASGLSLDRIQARLHERGTGVSITALSYWQSGKRQPERPHSLSAVRSLEVILNVAPGSLLGLLTPPRRRGSASRRARSVSGLQLLCLHERCEVAADGGQRAVTATAVLLANANGQNRWPLAYRHGDGCELRALRNCRADRDSRCADGPAELIFDRTIDRNETQLVEYAMLYPGPPFSADRHAHFQQFDAPVREYLLEIRFAPDNPPGQCWQFSQDRAGNTTSRKPLAMDSGIGVHAIALDFGPGVFGVEWETSL